MVENQKSEIKNPKFIFGPVPSRRLGRSLGVDLVPFKTCTFDCVYCQIGRTTHRSLERREFVPLEPVVDQLRQALDAGPRPDYITLAGSGEPTLYLRMGELIDRIHAMTDVPVDIITNGSTLWMDDVFADVVKADLVVPSLDAGDEPTYQKINRSVIEITFQKLLAGLRRLSDTCPEKVWLEVFLVAGMNDDADHVRKIADLADRLHFAKVQLNTAVRPPAESFVHSVPLDRLEELARLFTPPAEVIADFPPPKIEGTFRSHADAVLEMLRRRPCTADDLAAGLCIPKAEALKLIDTLLLENKIQSQRRQDREYYLCRTQ